MTHAEKCPICGGYGYAPKSVEDMDSSSCGTYETCRACGGKGWVNVDDTRETILSRFAPEEYNIFPIAGYDAYFIIRKGELQDEVALPEEAEPFHASFRCPQCGSSMEMQGEDRAKSKEEVADEQAETNIG